MQKQLIKTTLLTLILVTLLTLTGFAAQWTVSKDPNRVAQYTDLQLAIDDATNGDTILVYGSTTNYGSINVFKPITLIGEGYNANAGLVSTITGLSVTRFNTTLSGSGSTIMGFDITSSLNLGAHFTGAVDGNRNLDSVTVLRCQIRQLYVGGDSRLESFSQINLINNIIWDRIEFGYCCSSTIFDIFDITFSNCVFDGSYFDSYINRSGGVLQTFQSLTNVKVYNSLFLSDENGLLQDIVGMVFEDNIFFGHELYRSDYAQVTWNNNLFYLVDQTADLFTNDNQGSGNLLNTDPLFTDYPATPVAFNYGYTQDFTLQAGSPALTASVSGDEIGIYGGTYPYALGARPPVPRITEVTIQDGTSSVPVGGTINFNFKAESGN